MKIIKILTAFFLCSVILILSGCKNFGSFSSGDSELKIGISEMEGNFNPFYSNNEADREIVFQMFRPIQRKGTNNKLINHSGGISYEFVGKNQVKYTVSIRDDMFFSDGKNITIDDIIFFYHFISDAKYDGIYSDWYLNDIVGLKEYYFDDKNYVSSISNIETKISNNYTLTSISEEDFIKYLVATNIDGKFDGDIRSLSHANISWKEYIEKSDLAYKLYRLGDNPEKEDLVQLIAQIEYQNNKFSYNPESWYRENLYKEYIEKNYSNGADVSTISGIKKINDYTCTVLFNSKNINDLSELNAIIVPSDYFSAEYIKGSPEKVKELQNISVSSGPYILTDYDEKEVHLSANEYYNEGECEFRSLRFIDLKDKDPIKSISSGNVDVVSTLATTESINKLSNKTVSYYVTNRNYYTSIFFNTRSLDIEARKAIMCLCSSSITLESEIGPYYTRLYSPISIRYAESPHITEDKVFVESAYNLHAHLSKTLSNLKVYYCGTEDDLNYIVLENLKNKLKEKGVTLDIVLTDEPTLNKAIISGEADLWLENVDDGSTCDKYDYYNSRGTLNKTALNNPSIDELTANIRTAVGFSNKKAMTEQLMILVMSEMIEYPLYQLQRITVYNTEKINPDSIPENKYYDGFAYVLPLLKQN